MFPPDYVIFRVSGNNIVTKGLRHIPRKGEKVDLGGDVHEVLEVTTEIRGEVMQVIVDLGGG